MKKISALAIIIAVITTVSTTVIFCYVPYRTENEGIFIDIVCALGWFAGMLTAYAEQVMYSERKRIKRWHE
mgnify:CR=1 FL=1